MSRYVIIEEQEFPGRTWLVTDPHLLRRDNSVSSTTDYGTLVYNDNKANTRLPTDTVHSRLINLNQMNKTKVGILCSIEFSSVHASEAYGRRSR